MEIAFLDGGGPGRQRAAAVVEASETWYRNLRRRQANKANKLGETEERASLVRMQQGSLRLKFNVSFSIEPCSQIVSNSTGRLKSLLTGL